MTTDALKYLGKLAEWLENAPDGNVGYGEFYASELVVKFEGEVIGTFVSDDPQWVFNPAKAYFGDSV